MGARCSGDHAFVSAAKTNVTGAVTTCDCPYAAAASARRCSGLLTTTMRQSCRLNDDGDVVVSSISSSSTSCGMGLSVNCFVARRTRIAIGAGSGVLGEPPASATDFHPVSTWFDMIAAPCAITCYNTYRRKKREARVPQIRSS